MPGPQTQHKGTVYFFCFFFFFFGNRSTAPLPTAPKLPPPREPTTRRQKMWRTSVSAEHVRLFFAVDAALRHASSDEHAPVLVRLAELRSAMDGTPGASIAAAAALKEACTEAGVVPTPLASLPGQSPSRPNEQGAQEVVPGLWLAPVFPVERGSRTLTLARTRTRTRTRTRIRTRTRTRIRTLTRTRTRTRALTLALALALALALTRSRRARGSSRRASRTWSTQRAAGGESPPR